MRTGRVVVIGTGTMGPGIAEVFALGGWRTVLCGRTAGSVGSGLSLARLAGANLETFGLLEPGRAASADERVSGSTDLDGSVARADLVVETVAEDIAVKRALFQRLERAAPPSAILVTNTSGLRISEIAGAVSRPERVAGMHWWNPPHLIPLVEVVMGERTDEATCEAVVAIAERLGKRPVVVRKDVPGFIANRLQYALLREAVNLVAEGVASASDVDRAMRSGPGLRYAVLGPLETADFIGLDIVAQVMDSVLPTLNGATRRPDLVERLVGENALGRKAGRGFYDYAGRRTDEVLTERDEKLARLIRAGCGRT